MSQVEVYDNQSALIFSETEIAAFTQAANLALPLALEHPANGGGVLPDLDWVEISIVDDPTIAQVHQDFMDIPGATDVITFAHGEIVISSETAQSYADEYEHSLKKELTLYIIHGLLHLSGHEDADPEEREAMEKIQFSILDQVFEE